MSRKLKELNDMLTAKQELMEQSVTAEQKRESVKIQQSLEKKVVGFYWSLYSDMSGTAL